VKKIFSLGRGGYNFANHNNLQLFACFIMPTRRHKNENSWRSTLASRAPYCTKSTQKNRFSKKPVRETGLRNRLEAYPAEHTAVSFLAQTASQTDQYWLRSITGNLPPKFLMSFCLGFFPRQKDIGFLGSWWKFGSRSILIRFWRRKGGQKP